MKSLVQPRAIFHRSLVWWQKILVGLVVICGFGSPKSVHAMFRSDAAPSFSKRALKIKKAFEQSAPSPDQSERGPHKMQWGNWPNWQNWGNWNNWNNWGNWRNW